MPRTARPAESTTANGTQNGFPGAHSQTVRTTLLLPETLDLNLAAWCLQNRVRKNEGIVTILTRFLGSQGFQPGKKPDIKVGY